MKKPLAGILLIAVGATAAHADSLLTLRTVPRSNDGGYQLAAMTGLAYKGLPPLQALPRPDGRRALVLVRGHPECHGRKYHTADWVDSYDPDKFTYTPEYVKYGKAKQPSRKEAAKIAEQRFAELVTPKVVEMLRLVNKLRRSRGLTEMKMDPRLMLAAKRHNINIAQHALMQHTGTDCSQLKDRVWDSGYTWTKIAENLAGGNETATATLGQWTSSKRHLMQLTLPAMTEAGLAYDYNPHPPRNGIPIKHFWTLILARPDPWRDHRDSKDSFNDHLNDAPTKKGSPKGNTNSAKKS
jgi:uncharacterized protein YkwD